ncbi:uncharacterized protein LOC129599702 [Paramacrobiotus metropolitanus]|uniref:uncharacterized protein LOC129599702 n=1 Tax=Paramacrobiotus metropolitanus TaxID=2943436 RepID=UPI00244576B5|nr:uncharacterized protein LOC129599702 [Paramacrobiotus metropolitanus]
MPSRKKLKHHADDGQPATDARIPTQPHLLREIFQSLDSVRRLQLRRVCPLWNTVLTGADSSHTVRVSFDMDPGVIYVAVGSLLKCLDHSTQRLIVEDVGGGDVGVVMTVMGRMLRTLRIKTIVFHRVSFDWDDTDEFPVGEEIVPQENQPEDRLTLQRGITRLATVLKAWAGFCEELRLCRCKFSCDDLMEAVIPHATIKLDAADMAEQIWGLYETHLSRERLDIEYLAEWIRTGSAALRRMVTEFLENYQSADPRLTVHYRGKQWTAESLKDLDLTKLTTITLRALAEALPAAWEDGEEQNSEEVDDSEEDDE